VAAYSPGPAPGRADADDVQAEKDAAARRWISSRSGFAGEINAATGQTVEILVETRRRASGRAGADEQAVSLCRGEEDLIRPLVAVRITWTRGACRRRPCSHEAADHHGDDFWRQRGGGNAGSSTATSGRISSTSCMTNTPAWPQAAAYLKSIRAGGRGGTCVQRRAACAARRAGPGWLTATALLERWADRAQLQAGRRRSSAPSCGRR